MIVNHVSSHSCQYTFFFDWKKFFWLQYLQWQLGNKCCTTKLPVQNPNLKVLPRVARKAANVTSWWNTCLAWNCWAVTQLDATFKPSGATNEKHWLYRYVAIFRNLTSRLAPASQLQPGTSSRDWTEPSLWGDSVSFSGFVWLLI